VKNFILFKSIKLLTKTDIIVVCLILCSALLSFAFIFFPKKEMADCTISINNEVFETFSLNQKNTILIDSLAVIEIKENMARISYSTCQNQHCV